MTETSDGLDTFPGLVVAFVLDEINKDDMAATAWLNQSDEARRERLDAMIERADKLAQALVNSVQSEGMTRITGTLEEVQFKKGVKIVITAAKSQQALYDLAHEAGGSAVHILMPQLAMNLTADSATQGEMLDDAGGVPNWTPPDDDDGPDGPMGDEPDDEPTCICRRDENGAIVGDYMEGCPVHDDDGGPAHGGDDTQPPDPDRPPQEGEPGYIRPPGTIHDSEAKKDRITKDPQ